MHTHFMKCYGDYLKEHYSDLSKMTHKDLCEAKDIACVMKSIFDADTQYNIIEQMEKHDDISNIDMTWSEFEARFRKFYEESDASTKEKMKTEIVTIMT